MNIQWNKKDVPLTSAMIDRVQLRADNIQEKFPDEEFSLTVSLIQNKGRKKPYSYRLKGVLTQGGLTIPAESREMDYYDAVDGMMDTLIHNYKKEREKRERQNRQSRRQLKEYLKPTEVTDEYDEYEDFEYEHDEAG